MGAQRPPKVVLFDIGGVVVRSPFQGILDFERKNGLPTDWINFAIRSSSPNGYWQRLERGEITLDAAFFAGFTADLQNDRAWHEYNTSFRGESKRLKNTANPSQLGDHVSLKAETEDSNPTDQDRGAQSLEPSPPSSPSDPASSRSRVDRQQPSFLKLAKDTTIGDPVSLEAAEIVELEEGDAGLVAPPTRSTAVSHRPPGGEGRPSIPKVDGETLFWGMMSASREPDPYIFPALQRLRKLEARPMLGALSNTVVFPPDHPWSKRRGAASSEGTSGAFPFDPVSLFDVYVASAEVGLRKPSREIYELTLRRLNERDGAHGGQGIRPEDVVFLDDIGENLKTAKQIGMRTIRVQLGKTWRAVKELETVLGVELMDDKTRRAKL